MQCTTRAILLYFVQDMIPLFRCFDIFFLSLDNFVLLDHGFSINGIHALKLHECFAWLFFYSILKINFWMMFLQMFSEVDLLSEVALAFLAALDKKRGKNHC